MCGVESSVGSFGSFIIITQCFCMQLPPSRLEPQVAVLHSVMLAI
jgi:hypothetical protein